MAQLSISNIINVSVSQTNLGLNAYNTSNLGLFTDDAPLQPVQTLVFSGVAASGTFILTFAGNSTAAINWNDSTATIQSKIQAVTGLSGVTVSGTIASETLTLTQLGKLGAIPLPTISSNSLETSGSVAITILATNVSTGWSGGSNGYSAYVTPAQVAIDFGSESRTFQMANAVFSQQPNILAGNGQLIIILLQVATETWTFSGVAASGTFIANWNGNASAAINWNDTAAQIQVKLQAISGLSQVVVTGSIASETLNIYMAGVYGSSPAAFTFTSNGLETSGSTSITITNSISTSGESIGSAITRTSGLVQYFGIIVDKTVAIIGQTDLLAAAAVVQSLNKIAFFVTYNVADIQSGGMIDLLQTGSFTQSRGLYYGDSSNGGLNAVLMAAAYASRGLSVNFTGSNTTSTQNLKTLISIQPDPSMTQNIYNTAEAAGADIYASVQGDPAVISFGANDFFDDVYNLQWFVGAIQIAGYNYLAQTATKIPQTETGMDGLKGAYRNICQQAVTNQYLAPGSWTSPTTFGNQQLFLQNIAQQGYYIYSQPIAQQLQTNRAARQAPLVQIAIKQAGAIQQSSVIIYVNQ